MTHTFAMNGAYVVSATPSTGLLANTATTVMLQGVGFFCAANTPPDIKVMRVVCVCV